MDEPLNDIRAYEDLANAIILQAVKDYKSSPGEVERFFKSQWCSELTSIDGSAMIKIARDIADGKYDKKSRVFITI